MNCETEELEDQSTAYRQSKRRSLSHPPNQTKPNQTIPCRKLNIVYGVIHRKPKGLEDQQPHKQNPHFQSIRVHVIRKYIIFGYASFLLLLLEKMKPTAYQ